LKRFAIHPRKQLVRVLEIIRKLLKDEADARTKHAEHQRPEKRISNLILRKPVSRRARTPEDVGGDKGEDQDKAIRMNLELANFEEDGEHRSRR
jgi:hypothetical protein